MVQKWATGETWALKLGAPGWQSSMGIKYACRKALFKSRSTLHQRRETNPMVDVEASKAIRNLISGDSAKGHPASPSAQVHDGERPGVCKRPRD
jgi:hypothetical protein